MRTKTSLFRSSGAVLGAVLAIAFAGATAMAQDAKPWKPVTSIDFSAQHERWIENFDGTRSRMDEPHFWSKQIAPGTWQILDDGDYFYLIEGDKEAMLVDGGYGPGNPRAYAQTLTKKPIHFIANTHSHFDHVANNGYFDKAYMSQVTKDNLPKPSAAFAGITFPTDYPIEVIEEGHIFDLGGRKIEAIMEGNHTAGSTAYLDRKQRILFSGDDIMGPQGMNARISVENFAKMIDKLAAHRKEFDTVAAGWEMMPATWIDKYQALAKSILDGSNLGVPAADAPAPLPNNWKQNSDAPKDANGLPVYFRHVPRGGGGIPDPKAPAPAPRPANPNLMRATLNGATITYDRTKIRD